MIWNVPEPFFNCFIYPSNMNPGRTIEWWLGVGSVLFPPCYRYCQLGGWTYRFCFMASVEFRPRGVGLRMNIHFGISLVVPVLLTLWTWELIQICFFAPSGCVRDLGFNLFFCVAVLNLRYFPVIPTSYEVFRWKMKFNFSQGPLWVMSRQFGSGLLAHGHDLVIYANI